MEMEGFSVFPGYCLARLPLLALQKGLEGMKVAVCDLSFHSWQRKVRGRRSGMEDKQADCRAFNTVGPGRTWSDLDVPRCNIITKLFLYVWFYS